MKYDFETMIDRRGTNSLKWNVGENELPMWVADMDFQTAPEIIEALKEKVCHGIFGYTIIPNAWHEAIMGWWRMRHNFEIKKEWLRFCTGVIPAIDCAIRALTNPGEKILMLTPIYNHFFISIEENEREAVECQLEYDGSKYWINYVDLEAKLADPKTPLMILSNPHNPTGNIWEKETLARIGELCQKHQVTVIADEIHCDLTDPGYAYTPFASVSETCAHNSITCIAPTKAFNIAGLQTAAVVVPAESLREKVQKALEVGDSAEPSAFAIDAAVAAFTKGAPWLDALRAHIFQNKQLAGRFIAENIPEVSVVSSHATYLIWLDFSEITDDSTKLCQRIREETGLYMNIGEIYGGNGGQFARLNVACQSERLKDGLARLAKGIQLYKGQKGERE